MTAVEVSAPARSGTASLLARSALAVGVSDAVLAIALYVVVLHRTTVPRIFQGIASVLLGPAAFKGGAPTIAVGVAMHFGVALAWSVVLLTLIRGSATVRRTLASRYGALRVAAWFGPLVYVTMTIVVIPLFTHRMPKFDTVWLTVLLGHIPFVGLPMAAILRGEGRG
jgi:hypothetical protein